MTSRNGTPIDPKERLRVIIDSNTPLVIIETVEEDRAISLIRSAASDLQMPVFEWSIADGLARSGAQTSDSDAADKWSANISLSAANLPPLPSVVMGKDQHAKDNNAAPAVYNTKEAAQVLAHLQTLTIEAVFILKDLHRQMDSPVVIRLLREVAHQFSRDRRTLVLTAPAITVPDELRNQVEYLDLPLPDKTRLRTIIDEEYSRLGKTHKLHCTLDAAGLDAMAANLCGLTEEEAERAVGQAVIGRYGLQAESVTDVLDAKRESLRHSGMLEFITVSDNMNSVGGLENLKKWLKKRGAAFSEGARAAGLEPPKGVIIMGVQGCGKSMCARCIAGEWQLPLVKFDASAIYDKYIGETEKHIQKMFRVAEQLAPCVLWIDELEKVFAGSGPDSASSDAGTSARLLGAFLSWMQDRKSPVFVAATSNNVMVLPPELIRKGRFDELFFVDLPNIIERRSIFTIQLQRRHFEVAKFDLVKLVAASNGYSGAEIDMAIQSGMYACFADKAPMSTETLLRELAATIPLSATRSEDIARLRDWAKRAVPASEQDKAGASA